IAVALLLIEDLYTGLTGGDSLITELWDKWKAFMKDWLEDKGTDPWWLSAIKQLLRWIFDTKQAFKDMVDSWRYLWTEFEGGLVSKVGSIGKVLADSLNPFAFNYRGTIGTENDPLHKFNSQMQTMQTRGPPRSVSAAVHVGDVTIQTTGDPNDIATKMRK